MLVLVFAFEEVLSFTLNSFIALFVYVLLIFTEINVGGGGLACFTINGIALALIYYNIILYTYSWSWV